MRGRSFHRSAAEGTILAASAAEMAFGPMGTPAVAACAAPGTDPAYVDAVLSRVREASGLNERYFIATRWSFTATSGATQPAPAGVNLTYSFPSDNLSLISGGSPPLQSNVLNAKLVQWAGSVAAGKQRFRAAFDRWQAVAGLRYTEVSDDDAPWLNSPGQIGARGDIRIIAINIDGPGRVLAFNYFPTSCEMVLDSADDFSNPNFFANVVCHEAGHGWGADHVCPATGTKLMEPFANASLTGPQLDDRRGVQTQYGDTYGRISTSTLAASLGLIGATPVVADNLSVGVTDTDWFRIQISSAGALRVDLDFPGVPASYASYQQTQTTCPGGADNVFPRNVMRLALTLLASDGVTALRQATMSSAGQALSLQPLTGVTPGTQYFVRVNPVIGQGGDLQVYTLTIRSVPRCAGDVNIDGVVNFLDLSLVVGQYGQTGSGLTGDANNDGRIDFTDLSLVIGNFGVVCQ